MPEISKIKVKGTKYDVKDSTAREDILTKQDELTSENAGEGIVISNNSEGLVISTTAEENVIEEIQLNGSKLNPDANKMVHIEAAELFPITSSEGLEGASFEQADTYVELLANEHGLQTKIEEGNLSIIKYLVDKSYVDSSLSLKQDELVSGTNIKTINNESLLGSGNIDLESDVFVATYGTTTYANLKDALDNNKAIVVDMPNNNNSFYITYSTYTVGSDITLYTIFKSGSDLNLTTMIVTTSNSWSVSHDKLQDKLISGTNIKTINNTSLLGSGDVELNEGKIDKIKVNGTEQTITNKEVDLTVPTKVSDLTNDSNFQTDTEVSSAIDTALANGTDPYLPQSDIQQLIDDELADITSIEFEVVQTLPASGVKGTIYLLHNPQSATDVYDEYIWVTPTGGTAHWEMIGTTEVDLSDYYTSTEIDDLLDNKQDLVSSPTANNILVTNASGQAVDGGKAIADLGDVKLTGATGGGNANIDLRKDNNNYINFERIWTQSSGEEVIRTKMKGGTSLATYDLYTKPTVDNLLTNRPNISIDSNSSTGNKTWANFTSNPYGTPATTKTMTIKETDDGISVSATDMTEKEIASVDYVDNAISAVSGNTDETSVGQTVIQETGFVENYYQSNLDGDQNTRFVASITSTNNVQDNLLINIKDTVKGINDTINVLPESKTATKTEVGDLTTLTTDNKTSLVNAINEVYEKSGEPFRVKNWSTSWSAGISIDPCTTDKGNTGLNKLTFSIDDVEGADYQIVGMIAYEVFDAVSGGNRLNMWPVCQFTGNGQKELSVRWVCAGTTTKTARRINAWVLLKHR